ncbi:MAG: hypothetical protein V4564_14230 [Pseudomonadota bacterium]|uniref:hypothetical protein n=1 Tax=Sphingomonas sp. ERG5 TaxID=1381597 RepID=UPI00054C1F5C|nr:hypothetical protein [Sphingomonas sp. ERG5]
MRVIHFILAGALLMGGGVAQAERLSPEAKLAKILDGRVAGAPVNCIQLYNIQSSEIVDKTAIVYRGRNGTLYVNRVNGSAAFLDDDDILVSKTYSSQLCSIDIIQLVDRSSRMSSGSVSLGEFIPYPKPPKTAAAH